MIQLMLISTTMQPLMHPPPNDALDAHIVDDDVTEADIIQDDTADVPIIKDDALDACYAVDDAEKLLMPLSSRMTQLMLVC